LAALLTEHRDKVFHSEARTPVTANIENNAPFMEHDGPGAEVESLVPKITNLTESKWFIAERRSFLW
jgi:hypothetical protein